MVTFGISVLKPTQVISHAESVFSASRRYVVDAALMPWMASADSADRQPAAFQRAMGLDRLTRISRAGRMEAALRAEKGRQQVAVGVDQCDQQGFHGAQ